VDSHKENAMTSSVLKTRWLLPLLIVGLAVLTVQAPAPPPPLSLAGVSSAAETEAIGLESVVPQAAATGPTQAAPDSAANGTY